MVVRYLNVENGGTCPRDYLEFKFSNREAFKLCGFQIPQGSIVGNGPARVTFRSNEASSYNGFLIQYQGNC